MPDPERGPATRSSPYPLPTWVYAGWGLGTLAPSLVLNVTNLLLLRYMTDHLGIAAAVGSSLIALSKIYDAVTDPFFGAISDHTKTRWGRRRPFILAGTAGLAAVLIAMFWNPDFESANGATIYMGAMLILYATVYSLFSIPYMAMPAEMTRGYHERSYLMSFRVYAVGLAGFAASAGGPALIGAYGGGAAGHLWMAVTLAPIVIVAGTMCFIATAQAPFTVQDTSRPRVPLVEQLRLAAQNRPFMVLLAIKFFTLMTLGISAAFPFFFQRILKLSDGMLGAYLLVSSFALMLSQPAWLAVARRIGKKNTYLLALAIPCVVSPTWFLASPGEPFAFVLGRALLGGFASGGALLMGQSLLPDTMDYDYRRTGLRREGIFSGLYTTMEKAAGAIGVASVGAFLTGMGYVQSKGGKVVEQPQSAIFAILLCVALLPALVNLASAIALLFYDLDEEKLAATQRVT